MKVTIYTDASFCSARKLGAWAAWCRSDRGRVQKAALCPEFVKTCFNAELCAGLEGLRLAKATWPDTTFAWVVSDCEGIRPHLEGRPTKNADPVVRRMREEVAALGVQIEARWVKGHQSPRVGTQAWLNNAVDGLAGQVLRASKQTLRMNDDSALQELRFQVRGALNKRYGSHLIGVIEGRQAAANLLGVKRIKVSKMSATQCALVLEALKSGGHDEHRAG